MVTVTEGWLVGSAVTRWLALVAGSWVFGEVAEALRNVAHERVEGPAGLGHQHAFIGQFEAARSAPAQRHTELGLEPLESEAERWLLAPERAPGTPA